MSAPLWMPEGSVRATLAYILVGSTVYALLTQGLDVSAPLFILTTVVVKDYFEVRKGS